MKKKILLAVDDSLHSKNAIRYALSLSPFVTDLSYVLLNVQPGISQFLTDEAKTSLKAQSELEKVRKQKARKSQEILEQHKSRMIADGVDADRIEVRTQAKNAGLARDILEYAQERLCDAIVVGRRGLTRMQEMFMGSVTQKLLEHSKLIPVWMVDGEVTSRKIMIATDGSESALRAVDHVSFMFSGASDVRITLFHVVPKLKDFCKIDTDETDGSLEEYFTEGDKRCVESFLLHARKKFTDAGIREDQIEIKEARAIANVGGTIAEEAEKGGYGTVVVGRRGIDKAFFMGSVSSYVISKVADRAVWLIP